MNHQIIKKEISDKLLEYQRPHANQIANSLKHYSRALDASDTGTGKTYSSISVSKNLDLKPFIICPKSVISGWKKALDHFKCPYYGIANYELLKNCRWYKGNYSYNNKNESEWKFVNIKTMNREKCPFIKIENNKNYKIKESIPDESNKKSVPQTNKEKFHQILDDIKAKKAASLRKKNKKTSYSKTNRRDEKEFLYKWTLPSDILIIFDEAHRCKNNKTTNSDILISAANTACKILMLSATIADKPEYFSAVGYTLGLYAHINKAKGWLHKVSQGKTNTMTGIHDAIYPKYASRMRIKELGDLFPANRVYSDCFEMDKSKEIEEQYKIIEEAVEALKNQENQSDGLGKIIKARMKIEMLKVPTFIELSKAYLEEGSSVAIFVNFTDTLLTIAGELNTNCLIYGEQTYEEREKNIEDYMADKKKLIICNIRAGGVGISLHDLNGNYPRVSIISPSWSAQDIIQVIGRVHRAKGKTPVRQQLVYCAGTIEEDICKSMVKKIKNIAFINDKKTNAYKIKGLLEEETADNIVADQTDNIFEQIQVLLNKRQKILHDLGETNKSIAYLKKIIEASIS